MSDILLLLIVGSEMMSQWHNRLIKLIGEAVNLFIG